MDITQIKNKLLNKNYKKAYELTSELQTLDINLLRQLASILIYLSLMKKVKK